MSGAPARRSRRPVPALVSLVGAGPGDPALLTIRAAERIAQADVVYYDGLVPAAIVNLARRARRISVARRAGAKALTQAQLSARLIAAARRGRRTVRLKGGDPFVFGRGGEEAQALAAAGVPFEVVPGVTSALAAPALAGIPVTHRGVSSGVVVLSGHRRGAYAPVLRSLLPGAVTLVVLMGLAERRALARCLVRAGWSGRTPVAVVLNASQPGQRVWTGTLETLGARDAVDVRHEPGVIVVGDAVGEASPLLIASTLSTAKE